MHILQDGIATGKGNKVPIPHSCSLVVYNYIKLHNLDNPLLFHCKFHYKVKIQGTTIQNYHLSQFRHHVLVTCIWEVQCLPLVHNDNKGGNFGEIVVGRWSHWGAWCKVWMRNVSKFLQEILDVSCGVWRCKVQGTSVEYLMRSATSAKSPLEIT